MKKMLKIAVVATTLTWMLIPDLTEAVFGTRRRTAVVVGSTVKAADSAQVSAANQQAAASQQQAAAANQQAAASQQQAAAAEKEAADAKQQAAAVPAAPPTAEGKPLPIGTVVPKLPAGCAATPVGDVAYYYCGGNFYRAVYQENNLVYVTAKPK